MSSTTISRSQPLQNRRETAASAGRVVLTFLAAGIALAFAVYTAVALTGMSQNIGDMRTAALNRTNQQLSETNAHFKEANASAARHGAAGSNDEHDAPAYDGPPGRYQASADPHEQRLTGMSQDSRLTVTALTLTNGKLRLTNKSLASMQAQITTITHKITHAKILF
ncbi:MAG: hypothetical protein ABR508_02035 [Candidatus Baltobacteraceae bacterium]